MFEVSLLISLGSWDRPRERGREDFARELHIQRNGKPEHHWVGRHWE